MIKTGCCGFGAAMGNYFEKFGLVEVQKITYLRLHGSHARMYKHRYSDGELSG